MIVIRLMGGLGNQMHQYALYQKFISMGRETYLDTSWYDSHDAAATSRTLELSVFPKVEMNIATAEQITRVTGNPGSVSRIRDRLFPGRAHHIRESRMYHPEIFIRDDLYLDGYWSAEKYYADILPRIRSRFDFAELLKTGEADPAIGMMAHRIDDEVCACSVHLRRGDYLDGANAGLFGGIATQDYYDAAFDLVRDAYPGVRFYIFSDDPDYTKERYGGDDSCVIVDVCHGADSMYDIYLMSLCSAHICANSSFSYWGARMDPGHEKALNIRPTIHVNTQTYDPDVMKDLWPGWTFISPEGETDPRKR